jgi:hypothetical protein
MAMEQIVSGRSAAALMKRAQTLANKGDDSMIELAEVICDLRTLPKPPDGRRPTLDEPASRIKLSRRAVCYLLKVWQTFDDLGIPRERLVEVGWTKAAVVLENSEPEDVEEALALAETCTAKELPALLKGSPPKSQGPHGAAPPHPTSVQSIRSRHARERRSTSEEGTRLVRQGDGIDENSG